MKRSKEIVLVLSALAAGAGCERSQPVMRLSADNVYTNNHYVPGVGYYHAPFHGWFPFPYNSYASGRGYYYGGNWNAAPDQQQVAASRPTADSVSHAQSTHTAAVRRVGFGGSTRGSSS